MHAGIGAERQLSEIALFHFDEMLFVLSAEPFQHGWMHDDSELKIRFVPRAFLENLAELPLNLYAHGQSALDLAAAFAVRAVVIYRCTHTFGMPLPGHFHQAKLRDWQNVCLRLVTSQPF